MKKGISPKDVEKMNTDLQLQCGITRILKKLYTREHLSRSIGKPNMVERMYSDERDDRAAKARIRLRVAIPPTGDDAEKREIMRVLEFELKMQGKYLGGMYRPTVFSCPEELWYTYMQGKLRM